jgi:oligopeptide transport system substrate-binding protein
MIFSRKPDYHGRFRGNLQCVELYFTGENPSAKLKMYETGDLDIFDLAVLPPLEMDQARYRHAEEYMPYPVLNTSYVGFNVSQQPFIDRRVRRAFAMAIDRKALVDVILKGYQIPATDGLIPPAMPGYSAANGLPNDRDRSGQLLAEAGFQGGRGFPELDLLALPESLPVCQYLQAQWQANLGVKVGYQITERGLFFDRLNREPPPMHIWGWVADYPDPDNFLRVGHFRHYTRWRNEAYDRLVEDARRVIDRGKRMQLYAHADRILVEEAPIVPLAHEARHLLVKPWVSKFPTSATRRWFWKDVIIEPH